jgi:hypothetical protein
MNRQHDLTRGRIYMELEKAVSEGADLSEFETHREPSIRAEVAKLSVISAAQIDSFLGDDNEIVLVAILSNNAVDWTPSHRKNRLDELCEHSRLSVRGAMASHPCFPGKYTEQLLDLDEPMISASLILNPNVDWSSPSLIGRLIKLCSHKNENVRRSVAQRDSFPDSLFPAFLDEKDPLVIKQILEHKNIDWSADNGRMFLIRMSLYDGQNDDLTKIVRNLALQKLSQ